MKPIIFALFVCASVQAQTITSTSATASQLAAETAARQAGDTANAAAITSEASTRAAADSAHTSSIATNASAIASEITARAAADATHAANISANAAAITTETNRATAAEADLTTSLANTTAGLGASITALEVSRALEAGRSINDSISWESNSGTLAELMSRQAKALKTITGKSNWRTTPATTLEDAAMHAANTNNPHVVTKSQVGLGNVDNTSDANKPVSAAQAAALAAETAARIAGDQSIAAAVVSSSGAVSTVAEASRQFLKLTLAAGSVTVADATIDSLAHVVAVPETAGTGLMRVAVTAGTGFTITSSDPADTRTVRVLVQRSGYDADAAAYFARASVTDLTARAQWNAFTLLAKELMPTLYPRLMLVPCRSKHGYLHPFGGGAATFPSGTTQFAENGTVTEDNAGAAIAYASNWPNRIQTPAAITNYNTQLAPLEPFFIGSVFMNDAPGPNYANQSVEFIHWNFGTTSQWLSTYAGWNSDYDIGVYHVGVGGFGMFSAQYRHDALYVNDTTHVPHLYGVDIKDARKRIVTLADNYLADLTHATAEPDTNANTGLYFYPGIAPTGTTSGKLQFVVWIANGIIGAEAEARLLFPIMQATVLSDLYTGSKTFHIARMGQSNSDEYSFVRLQRKLNAAGYGFTGTVGSYGGTPIGNWLGTDTDNPIRASQYTGGIYDATSAQTAMENNWPRSVRGNGMRKVFDWVQGESDTELLWQAQDYQKQLENLRNFVLEDLGSDTLMSVGLIDYGIAYRTGSTQGDFALSGLSSPDAAANGTYAITAVPVTVDGTDPGLITTANTSYSWTKGAYTIALNGAQWEIKNGATLIARSKGKTVSHPQLVTAWTLSTGTTQPVIGTSRTGQIEMVRAAQAAFVAAHPGKVVGYDSRGCARKSENASAPDYFWSDTVHMNNQGRTLFAERQKTALLKLP